MDNIVTLSTYISGEAMGYVSPEDVRREYPGIETQIETHPLLPAITLLAQRRATNGYADLDELAWACGIDRTSGAELRSLALRLSAQPSVAIESTMDIDSPAKYRLLA